MFKAARATIRDGATCADVEVAFAGETEKFDLKSSSGGIEFGYQAPISPITMTSDASLTSA